MTWVTDWAPTPADLDSCVTCGLCLPYCPTFRLTGDEAASPRGRLTAMDAVASGEIPLDDRFEEVMDFCLQCRACEAVCPSMVPFGRMMEGVRTELAVQRPSAGRVLRRLVVGRAVASRGLLGLATAAGAVAQRQGLLGAIPGVGRVAGGLRPLPAVPTTTTGRSWEPEGDPVGTVALFSGCVMDAWFQEVHHALVQVLRVAGYRVEAPARQTCCGALAAHQGAARDAARLARRNVAAFARYDLVVVDAAGCGAHLEDYEQWAAGGADLAERIVDATVLVARLLDEGRLPTFEEDRGPVAVQDPCHLRHAQRIVDEPRRVLRAAGYEPVEIDPLALCCGAAGAYGVTHPEASTELGARKAEQVRAAGTSVVASANPGCELQLRAHLDGEARVAHPVELYWEALAASASAMRRASSTSISG